MPEELYESYKKFNSALRRSFKTFTMEDRTVSKTRIKSWIFLTSYDEKAEMKGICEEKLGEYFAKLK